MTHLMIKYTYSCNISVIIMYKMHLWTNNRRKDTVIDKKTYFSEFRQPCLDNHNMCKNNLCCFLCYIYIIGAENANFDQTIEKKRYQTPSTGLPVGAGDCGKQGGRGTSLFRLSEGREAGGGPESLHKQPHSHVDIWFSA